MLPLEPPPIFEPPADVEGVPGISFLGILLNADRNLQELLFRVQRQFPP